MSVARAVAPLAFLAAVTAAVVLVKAHATRDTHVARVAAHVVAKRHVRHRHAATTVRIGPGDTLGAVAIRHHTTVAHLEQLNPGLDPTALRVGQLIKLK